MSTSVLLNMEFLTCNHSVDILDLSETWLSSSKRSSDFLVPGFQPPIRRVRTTSLGDGVAACIRYVLSVTLTDVPSHLGLSIEDLCFKVRLTARTKLNVIVTYRPPGPGADSYFSQLGTLVDLSRRIITHHCVL